MAGEAGQCPGVFHFKSCDEPAADDTHGPRSLHDTVEGVEYRRMSWTDEQRRNDFLYQLWWEGLLGGGYSHEELSGVGRGYIRRQEDIDFFTY